MRPSDAVDVVYGFFKLKSPVVIAEYYGGLGEGVIRAAAERVAKESGLEVVEYSDDAANRVLRSSTGLYFVEVVVDLLTFTPPELMGEELNSKTGLTGYRPPLWARVLSRHPGILIIRNISNKLPEEKLKFLSWVFEHRSVGPAVFRQDVLVTGIAQAPWGVRPISVVPDFVKAKAPTVEIGPITVKEWKSYMDKKYSQRWPRIIYEFLKERPYLMAPPTSEEVFETFPTPAKWEYMARLLAKFRDLPQVVRILAVTVLGKKAGGEFYRFLVERKYFRKKVAVPVPAAGGVRRGRP